ncbi:hypothetical protein STAQ_02700 [Allostella sp. ATCC 35155]|nr:hypothetical protein STAQ_02700 [Stella sp. ATCC 35155]
MSHERRGNACMFHIGRSGSTVLADQMGQHPDLVWAGEMLDHKRVRLGPATALALVEAGIRQAGGRRFGLEAKFYHLRRAGLELEPFVDRLEALGFDRFLVVRRRNLLRKVVSSQVARASRRWHLPAGREAVLHTVRIDPQRVPIEGGHRPLLDIIEHYLADFRRLDAVLRDRARLDLVFEEDIRPDPAAACRRTLDFLGLPPCETAVRLARTTPWPLGQIVENLDEVRACLAGSPHAWMTEDEEP